MRRPLDQPAPLGPSREVKDLMRGWAAGYNAWLKKNRINDPACKGAAWVRPVTALDVFSHAYAVAVLGGEGRLVDAITTAQPPTSGATSDTATAPDAKAAALATSELFSAANADMGSNAVAFRGDTTANGRGLLLGNPHYPWANDWRPSPSSSGGGSGEVIAVCGVARKP